MCKVNPHSYCTTVLQRRTAVRLKNKQETKNEALGERNFYKHLTLLSLYPIKRDSALKRGTIRRAKPKRLLIKFSAEFVDALDKVNPCPSCRTQFPSWDGETKWSSDLSECWGGLFAFRPENATILHLSYRGRIDGGHSYPRLRFANPGL